MTRDKLEKLTTKDINSLVLFALFQLKDNPEYATLSELSYILDKTNFMKLLEYYGGMTITIPTLSEFKLVLNCLLLYEYVDLEGMEFNKALKLLPISGHQSKDIREMYLELSKILAQYDFGGVSTND